MDLNGVSTFPTRETRSGWMPPLPRGGGVLPVGKECPDRHLLLRSSQPYTPTTTFHPWRLSVTRHQRRFTRFTRPIFLSPVPSGMKRRASGFPLSFAPHRYQRRTSGQGQAVGHWPEITPPLCRTSNGAIHSQRATSCRTTSLRNSVLSRSEPTFINHARSQPLANQPLGGERSETG